MNRLAMNWKKDQTLQHTCEDGQIFNVRVAANHNIWTASVIEPIGNEKSEFTACKPEEVYALAIQSIKIHCLHTKITSKPRYWQKGPIGQRYNGPSGCPVAILWQDHLKYLKEDNFSEHEIKLCKRSFYQAAFDMVHELIHFAHDPEEVLKAEAVWLHEVGENLGESLDWSDKFGKADAPSGTKPSSN